MTPTNVAVLRKINYRQRDREKERVLVGASMGALPRPVAPDGRSKIPQKHSGLE